MAQRGVAWGIAAAGMAAALAVWLLSDAQSSAWTEPWAPSATADVAAVAASATGGLAGPVADESTPGATAPPELPRMQPPRADEARIEVRVVDGRTGAALPGQLVEWHRSGSAKRRQEAIAATGGDDVPERPELIAGEQGERAFTDLAGVVALPMVGSWIKLMAENDELCGSLFIQDSDAPPPGGHCLVLHEDPPLHVEVLDAEGAPCADVPLNLATFTDSSAAVDSLPKLVVARTDARGRATIPHIRKACEAQKAKWPYKAVRPLSTVTWRVRALLLGSRDPGEVFLPAAPPTTPIQLRLPPLGAVAVQTPKETGPAPSSRLVIAHRADDGSRTGRLLDSVVHARVGDDGTARFPRVVSGTLVRFALLHDDELGAWCVAPPPDAGELLVTLSPRNCKAVFLGRAVGPDGRPLPRTELTLLPISRGDDVVAQETGTTDESGRFRLEFETMPPTPTIGLQFDAMLPHGVPLRAVLPGQILPEGERDLGDVPLAIRPMLVAGWITQGGEPYLGPGRLLVTQWLAEDDDSAGTPVRRFRWRAANTEAWRGPRGEFAVFGDRIDAPHRVEFEHHRLLAMTPAPFEPGCRDFAIELAPAAGLTATVLAPPGIPSQSLLCRLVPPTGDLPPDDADDGPLTGACNFDPPGCRDIVWSAVPPGRYRLVVSTWLGHTDLATIPDVMVPPPPGGDPRLVDIDLRQCSRTVSIRVVPGSDPADTDGGRYQETHVLTPPRRAGEPWRSTQFRGPEGMVLLPTGPYELLIAYDDRQPVRVTGNADHLEVRPDRLPTVRVRLPELPPLPVWASAWIDLQPAQRAGDMHKNLGAQPDPLEQLYDACNASQRVDTGPVSVRVGAGPHAVSLCLLGPSGTVDVELARPTVVTPADREVTMAVDPVAWRAAILRLGSAAEPAPAAGR